MNYEEYETRRDRRHKLFMKNMEEIYAAYRPDIQKSVDSEKDFHFYLWNALADAYNQGWSDIRKELFDLTDAEDLFREKIRGEI